MEIYRITAQLLANLAWPALLGAAVYVVLHRYSEEIRALFGRLLRLQTPVATAHFEPPRQDEAQTPSPTAVTASPGGDDQAQRAQAWMEWWQHEVTYRTIYGTQIEIVKQINLLVAAPSPALDAFYERHLALARQVIPEYEYARGDYVGYLENHRLIRPVDGTYEITDEGRAFLTYLTLMRIPEAKPY